MHLYNLRRSLLYLQKTVFRELNRILNGICNKCSNYFLLFNPMIGYLLLDVLIQSLETEALSESAIQIKSL